MIRVSRRTRDAWLETEARRPDSDPVSLFGRSKGNALGRSAFQSGMARKFYRRDVYDAPAHDHYCGMIFVARRGHRNGLAVEVVSGTMKIYGQGLVYEEKGLMILSDLSILWPDCMSSL